MSFLEKQDLCLVAHFTCGSFSSTTVTEPDSNQLNGLDSLHHEESMNCHQDKGQDVSQYLLHSFGVPFWMSGNSHSLYGIEAIDTIGLYGVVDIGEKWVGMNYIHIKKEKESVLVEMEKGYDTTLTTIVGKQVA